MKQLLLALWTVLFFGSAIINSAYPVAEAGRCNLYNSQPLGQFLTDGISERLVENHLCRTAETAVAIYTIVMLASFFGWAWLAKHNAQIIGVEYRANHSINT